MMINYDHLVRLPTLRNVSISMFLGIGKTELDLEIAISKYT